MSSMARDRVRELRRNATEAEKVLWERLRGRRLQGLKFQRQFPIGPFVADFCCRERRVIVEADGEGHATGSQVARDQGRDAYLQGQSYIVLRFTNDEILTDLENVLRKIAIATYQAPSTWHRA
jgi:very-short-patch-repair endonuclease